MITVLFGPVWAHLAQPDHWCSS